MTDVQTSVQCGQKVPLRPHEGCETERAGRHVQVVSQNCHNWWERSLCRWTCALVRCRLIAYADCVRVVFLIVFFFLNCVFSKEMFGFFFLATQVLAFHLWFCAYAECCSEHFYTEKLLNVVFNVWDCITACAFEYFFSLLSAVIVKEKKYCHSQFCGGVLLCCCLCSTRFPETFTSSWYANFDILF